MARVSSLTCLLLPLVITFFATSYVNATIFIPEEIPSLLSVVYSNLPPIKKGTDSKLGVGFRLGPNADVQFQLEIGPQSNTLPIGAEATAAASSDTPSKKRHVQMSGGNSNPQEWLNLWRLKMSPGYVPEEGEEEEVDSNREEGTAGNSPSETVAHLRQLYRPQPMNTANYMT